MIKRKKNSGKTAGLFGKNGRASSRKKSASTYTLELLESRVLLSGDLAGAVQAMQIKPVQVPAQAVVLNVPAAPAASQQTVSVADMLAKPASSFNQYAGESSRANPNAVNHASDAVVSKGTGEGRHHSWSDKNHGNSQFVSPVQSQTSIPQNSANVVNGISPSLQLASTSQVQNEQTPMTATALQSDMATMPMVQSPSPIVPQPPTPSMQLVTSSSTEQNGVDAQVLSQPGSIDGTSATSTVQISSVQQTPSQPAPIVSPAPVSQTEDQPIPQPIVTPASSVVASPVSDAQPSQTSQNVAQPVDQFGAGSTINSALASGQPSSDATASSSSQWTAILKAWEANMVKYGKEHGELMRSYDAMTGADAAANSGMILGSTYYDAEQVYYQIAQYTGDQSWLQYAQLAQKFYRDQFVIPNNGDIPGYWNFTTGLLTNYEATGDPQSKNAILSISQNAGYAQDTAPLEWTASAVYARDVSYAVISYTNAEIAGGPARARKGELINQLLDYIDQWFVRYNVPPGGEPHPVDYLKPSFVGLAMNALIYAYDHSPDARITTALATALDGLWNRAWIPDKQSFWYANGDDGLGVTPFTPAPDLNLLIAPAYAWMYKHTGDVTYRDRGDQIFAGGVSQAYLDGAKQFNQNYEWSFDYVAWRAEAQQMLSQPSPMTTTAMQNDMLATTLPIQTQPPLTATQTLAQPMQPVAQSLTQQDSVRSGVMGLPDDGGETSVASSVQLTSVPQTSPQLTPSVNPTSIIPQTFLSSSATNTNMSLLESAPVPQIPDEPTPQSPVIVIPSNAAAVTVLEVQTPPITQIVGARTLSKPLLNEPPQGHTISQTPAKPVHSASSSLYLSTQTPSATVNMAQLAPSDPQDPLEQIPAPQHVASASSTTPNTVRQVVRANGRLS